MPQAERQGWHFTEVREMYVEIYKVSMPCEKGAGKRPQVQMGKIHTKHVGVPPSFVYTSNQFISQEQPLK